MSALDFLAELSAVVPDHGQHLVSYWGRHSNRARGSRDRAMAARVGTSTTGAAPAASDPMPAEDPVFQKKRKTFRLAWAALLRKVWNVDALACPRCTSPMRVLAAITQPAVIERILRHVGLFDLPRAPNSHDCPTPPLTADGQALLIFPSRPLAAHQATPAPEHDGDPRLHDSWPVDPPFVDD